jgi:phospholipase D1/2
LGAKGSGAMAQITSTPALRTETTASSNGDAEEYRFPPRVSTSEKTEFPFHSSVGGTGVVPTNDLVHRMDHALRNNVVQGFDEGPHNVVPVDSNTNGSIYKPLESGYATPPRRKSVQFARGGVADTPDSPSAPKLDLKDGEEHDDRKESHGSRLLSRLKSLTSPMSLPGHIRSQSNYTLNSEDGDGTPRAERERNEEDDWADADAEESGAETPGGPSRLKPKRKSRRSKSVLDAPATAPTTPRALKFPSFHRSSTERSPPPADSNLRPVIRARTNTMTEIPENQRLAFSEDEGRGKLAKRPRTKPRPSGLRRIAGIASSSRNDPADGTSPLRQGRTHTTSAVKWRQLKAGLKLLSAKKKEDNRLDHAKSAELMAELLAGAPAALLLASMFQRDEHGRKRIPVLLEQLKVNVTDSTPDKNKKEDDDRHLSFRIELEYASALVRMKWVIHRTWKDFAKLHYRYKVQMKGDDLKHFRRDNFKLPKFPRRAVPYLRGIRGLYESDEEEDDDLTAGEQTAGDLTAGEQSGLDGDLTEGERPGLSRRRRSSFNFVRSAFGPDSLSRFGSSFGKDQQQLADSSKKESYNERIRRRLELYLQQMINCVIFRPISNRLCKFLELSALGVRLAPEGGYHGKEGYLLIKSSKGVDYRKKLSPRLFINRHTPKWFLVRHSYVVCVDSPDQLIVYDVFLVDPYFAVEKKKTLRSAEKDEDEKPLDLAKRAGNSAKHPNHHQLKMTNSERVTKVLARDERLLRQFEESISFMVSQTEWAKPHRFQSFAPVRKKVWAQFLVDGQDYMWNVSRAIANAKDVIYIHDWWLSPEIYLRRPPAISQDWRLDRLLKRKADEGVKIFVIVYRNIESAIPISSDHTKSSLTALSPNIIIQRSPNQMRQNTFFWAHHEKVVVIDHTVAFCGGVDLCFGRWDTPEHRVTDDKSTGFEDGDFPRDSEHCQLWPGKDYSNPRIQDFFSLDKPYDEMYDRTKVPRMPWHDVGMQMIGQPARDLSRHFVQRWNFLLRQRDSTRPRPMLLPPPDFLPADLEALGLQGTCEVQILRSACEWSLGTLGRVECSIMNAYVECIRESEHLVYIENQFFITSCDVETTRIENKIGDALVERIIRADENDEKWRAIIVIPLVPGFQNTVDAMDGSSIRLIMQCQFYSICRGESSIFGRLRRQGIDPTDYIEFYALRSWGQIGPDKTLVTEQLYIHAKIMVVDDRIAIIGSANINERSMLGSRDSEVAAIVRDTDLISSRMAGKEYMVSRFAHDFRMRLMREHLGVDIHRHAIKGDPQPSNTTSESSATGFQTAKSQPSDLETQELLAENNAVAQESVLEAERAYQKERMVRNSISQADSTIEPPGFSFAPAIKPPAELPRYNTSDLGLPYLSQLPPLPATDDIDIGGPPIYRNFSSRSSVVEACPEVADMNMPVISTDCMIDPVSDGFFNKVWHTVAENNTALFRFVFRCMPDNEVRTWKEYKDYDTFYERFKTYQNPEMTAKEEKQDNMHGKSDTVAAAPATSGGEKEFTEKSGVPVESKPEDHPNITASATFPSSTNGSTDPARRNQSKRRRRATTKGTGNRINITDVDDEPVLLERKDALEMMEHVQGNLVVWPYDWLCTEMDNHNWNHAVDQLAPLEI